MGVRLIAVYTLVPAFSFASNLVLQTNVPLFPVLVQVLFMLIAGALLWFAAPAIGAGFEGSRESLQGLGLDLRALAQVGFGVVGMVLVVQAGAGLVQAIVYLAVGQAPVGLATGPSPMYLGELGWGVAQLVLGTSVFLGRRGLARLISAVRNY
jgi:hypothetical protein